MTAPTSTGPVFATSANLSNGGAGATFTMKQVINRRTPTANVDVPSDQHDVTITIATADSGAPLGSDNGAAAALGDGRATIRIAGLVPNGVELSTFAGDDDYETRDPTNPRSLGEFVLFDGTNNHVIVNATQPFRLNGTPLRYASRTAWTYQQRDAAGNVLETVQGRGILGFQTPINAIPPGSVKYDVNANVSTYQTSANALSSFGGSGTVTLDFDTGLAQGALNIGNFFGRLEDGEFSAILTLTNVPRGTVEPGDFGPITGSVFGPNAEEIGAIFEIDGTNGFAKGTLFGAQ